MKTFECKNCGEEKKWSYSTTNTYCSNRCAGEGRRKETIQRFYAGKVSKRETIRKVLIEERGDECEVCHITEWNGEPIVFQVDHINGRSNDDSPTNLRLICANCHSQTPHFGGANKGQGRKALGIRIN